MGKKFKKIEDINSIVTVSYATDEKKNSENLISLFKKELKIDLNIISDISKIDESNVDTTPDLFLIDHELNSDDEAGVNFCHFLRGCGYKGIIILCIKGGKVNDISNSTVTSLGFDNFLPLNANAKTLFNQIHWAILNRGRKNKNILQFDHNPDSLYTIDKNGHVFDINDTATLNCPFNPKEIVTKKINIKFVGTLPTFEKQIKPLIKRDNIGSVFEHTSDEHGIIYQVKVLISNLPIIGLVATVFKTDISHVIIARTLDIMTNSISLLGQRDFYTAGHSSRVFQYCANILHQLRLDIDRKFSKDLYCAALLHDIGKIGVRDQILLKPGKLSDDEFGELATHPVKGCDILKQYSFLADSIEFVRHHHEKSDGTGYPDQLTGKDIPLGAAIIAVADSFDAMTSTRPYRDSLNYRKAVQEIRDHAGTQFDFDVAQAFLNLISPELVENVIKASQKNLDHITREILDLIHKGLK